MRAARLVLAGLMVAGCGGAEDGETVRVRIPPGATVTAVAESLSAHQVIDSPRFFRLYAKVTGRDRSLQAGVYDFRQGMSMAAAMDILVSGRPAMEPITIPEGLMLTEIADLVERGLGIPRADFLAAARDSQLRSELEVRGETLEGYLYPSTYLVRVGASAEELVRQMVREFEEQWDPAWTARLDTLGMTRDELMTLASIVEGEARYPADLGYVSSVYHNRLARGMRLQADPTVIYALGRRRRLFERDYEIRSPYNTYLIDGLPPHPISQPANTSIEATLYPERSNFLYFVAGPDGKHVFSRTYREHLTAVRAVRAAQGRR